TIIVQSSELSIKNRKANALRLEDGLLPVSADDRDIILEYAAEHASWELYLLLTLGFYTGMRLGTLCDLKVSSLERAFI
ncbi:site-specific integrase, partial [Klebsiella pneumoniae]|nr:site-specific integrase [Klebsiella pneumoniae]